MPPRNRDVIAPPGSGSTSVFRGQKCAYVIESSSKLLIDSIYGLFLKYGINADFTMTLTTPEGHGGDSSSSSGSSEDETESGIRHSIHVSGSLNSEKTRRSIVTCTTLGDYMADQTVGMPNDRLARMLELIHEQMRDLRLGVPYVGAPYVGVPYYGLDDILIINDTFFCFFNDDKLFAFHPDTHRADVTRPISRDRAFYAPELRGRLHALPYEVDCGAQVYSLGLLTAFCALLKWDLVVNADSDADVKKMGGWRTYSESELTAMLDPIKYSKIYWFVLRCCRADANRRICVFV